MSSPLSLEEFAKLQVPAIRHDAAQLERWRRHPGEVDVQAIAARILRLHQTIKDQAWMLRSVAVIHGLSVLNMGIVNGALASKLASLTAAIIAETRSMLGDDPGPEPHGGPLAAQMALGVKKKA